jgi:hypothetical protein
VQDAASIISMAAAQQEDWESFEYMDVQQSQTAPFHSWLKVKVKDKILTTVHPSEHQRKQPARHLTCLNWIEAYLQDALVSPEQRVQPPQRSLVETVEQEQSQTKTAMLALQECAQRKQADASESGAIASI